MYEQQASFHHRHYKKQFDDIFLDQLKIMIALIKNGFCVQRSQDRFNLYYLIIVN